MKKIAIVALLSAFAAAPAVAADMYAGVRAGQAKTSIDNATLTTDSPTGFGVFGGYTINPNVSAEVEYLNLGEIKAGVDTAKSTGFGLGVVGSYPINEQFSVFGKLGYAMITSKFNGGSPDSKTNAVTYGVGGQYNVNSSVGVRLGWDRYAFDDSSNGFKGNASLISVGGVFKF